MKKIFLILAAGAMLASSCNKGPEFTYTTQEVRRMDITTSVTATGTIEPVTKVDVGTQVSGIVSRLYVDYNSTVKAGQVIAELDRTNLMSELASARAMQKSAQSDLAYQQLNYDRIKTLYEKGLVSTNDYDKAKLSYEQAKEAMVQRVENVKKAETNLGYATITSPIDGIVIKKEVEQGQTVASSFNTPTLFTIAQDLTQMRVVADVDEADIGEVNEGQRVTFTVDAFPNDVFEGKVAQVRLEPTTTSNVVTYEVVITAPNDDLKLKPGLTANVTIYTLELKDALAVPSKALRFHPSEAMLNEGETIVDNPAQGAKVWVKEGPELKAYIVETGTTNGMLTEVKSGVNEGMTVITDVSAGELEEEEEEQTTNPFMPRPRNRDNKKNTKK
jgi:HlyD family secretion protein